MNKTLLIIFLTLPLLLFMHCKSPFGTDTAVVGDSLKFMSSSSAALSSAAVSSATSLSTVSSSATSTTSISSATSSSIASAANLTETFSNGGAADFGDNAGWTTTFTISLYDHTGNGGRSYYGDATTTAPGTVIKELSINLNLGSNPKLSFWRNVDLTRLNTSDIAEFKVIIIQNSTEYLIHVEELTGADMMWSDGSWLQISNLSLLSHANSNVTLVFRTKNTNSVMSTEYARTYIDDITITQY